MKDAFPSIIPKTNEPRVETLESEWTYYSNIMYEASEKVYGDSISCGLIDGKFIVCNEDNRLWETDSSIHWTQARRYDIKNKVKELNLDNIIIQGVLIGPDIQENYYELEENDFLVFTIYDIRLGRYKSPLDRKHIVKQLELNHVPVVNENFIPYGMSIQEILSMSYGLSDLNPNKPRGGLVFKSLSGGTHWKAVISNNLETLS